MPSFTSPTRGAGRPSVEDGRSTDRRPTPSDGVTLAVAYVAISATLIGAGLLLTHLLHPVLLWDDHVNSWFASHRTSGWNRLTSDGSFVADTLGIVVVATVATLIGLLRRWGLTAGLVACGLAVELAAFATVNYVVARPRPVAPHLGATPSTHSFPSGHVAATLVLYGGIAVLVTSRTRAVWARVPAWIAAGVLVGWVGFSTVYEAEHHPTDVVAGAVLGVGALGAAVLAVRPQPPTERPTDLAGPAPPGAGPPWPAAAAPSREPATWPRR